MHEDAWDLASQGSSGKVQDPVIFLSRHLRHFKIVDRVGLYLLLNTVGGGLPWPCGSPRRIRIFLAYFRQFLWYYLAYQQGHHDSTHKNWLARCYHFMPASYLLLNTVVGHVILRLNAVRVGLIVLNTVGGGLPWPCGSPRRIRIFLAYFRQFLWYYLAYQQGHHDSTHKNWLARCYHFMPASCHIVKYCRRI